jgi:hypothetical protein
LAELLSDPVQLGDCVGAEVLEECRTLVDDAATHAATDAGWVDEEPLRLSKNRIGWLLRCPRRAVADPQLVTAGGDLDQLTLGSIVDAGAKLALLRARGDTPTVDDVLAFMDATGDTSTRQHLDELSDEAAALLRAEADLRLERFVTGWSTIEPAWWPRVEEPVRLRLAQGAVVVSGKLDVLLGGPPTGLPGVVVEVKSGRWHDAVRADGHLYALLVGLRDGVAPAAVLTVAAAEGETQLEPIRPAVLRHTTELLVAALHTAADLAAGTAPAACPGSYCTYCPLRATCPAAA